MSTEIDTKVYQQLIADAVEAALQRATGQPTWLKSNRCADYIGVTPQHLSIMRANGTGPPWSGAGKWIRYERSAVDEWLRNNPKD